MDRLSDRLQALTQARTYEEARLRCEDVLMLGHRRGDADLISRIQSAYLQCMSDHARTHMLWLLELRATNHGEYIAIRGKLTGK